VQHLDPDRLVTLALGDNGTDAGEASHLTTCAACRTELHTLRHIADLGAETQDLQALPPPPERIWAAIKAETNPDIVRVTRRPNRRRRPWMAPLLAAAAATVIAVTGTVAVTRLTTRPKPPAVTAQAMLTPLPTGPRTAWGDARVLAGDELEVAVRNLPLTTGYYEVWLIDPEDPARMMAIGNLASGPEVVLPLPPGADLNRYRLVDISAEAYDGDAAHSGRSLLRGTLTN
jgi:hypothetical protein